MPQENNEEGEIVITGRRGGRPTPQPRVIVMRIDIDLGGTSDLSDVLSQSLRDLFNIRTDFDIDETFTAKQKEIIVKAIEGIANHPQLAPAFANLLTKNVDINIRPVTRPFDQLKNPDDRGATHGVNPDGTVTPGATIDIYIRLEQDGVPATLGQIAERIVHELVHSLGDPTFDARIHADDDWARDIIRDVFRGYDFNAEVSAEGSIETILVAPGAGGDVVGTAGFDVFSGSDNADTIAPGAGGSFIYSGLGDDRFVIEIGGAVDVIIDDGGADRLVLAGVNPMSVTTRWSDDGVDLAVLVNGYQEAIFENAAGAGALEGIEIDGVLFATSAFASAFNVAPLSGNHHADYLGAFYGGQVASGATSDANWDQLTYRLGSVSGSYADRNWSVDPQTGAVQGHFFKEDQRGSEFTFVTLVVSDGLTTSNVNVTIRWAYSLEYDPQLARSFDPSSEPELASGVFEYRESENLVTAPEFG